MMNKNYPRRLLLLSLFWGSFFITAAQESRTLTLQECIDLSIKNSKQLRASNSMVAEAVAATQEAMERRLPDVNVNGSYLRVNKPHVNIKTAAASGGDSNAVSPGNINQAMFVMANVSVPLFAGFRIK